MRPTLLLVLKILWVLSPENIVLEITVIFLASVKSHNVFSHLILSFIQIFLMGTINMPLVDLSDIFL